MKDTKSDLIKIYLSLNARANQTTARSLTLCFVLTPNERIILINEVTVNFTQNFSTLKNSLTENYFVSTQLTTKPNKPKIYWYRSSPYQFHSYEEREGEETYFL